MRVELGIPLVDARVELCEPFLLLLYIGVGVFLNFADDGVFAAGEDLRGDLVEGSLIVGCADLVAVGFGTDDGGACFLCDDDACAHVPGPAADFPVEIKIATGDVAEVQSGRA